MSTELQLDLTTSRGLQRTERGLHIRRQIGKFILITVGWVLLIFIGGGAFPPLLAIILPALFLYIIKVLFFPARPTAEVQIATAREAIAAAKQNGVQHMKLKVSRQVGVAVQSEIRGVPIKASIGTANEMLLEIEFPPSPPRA